MALNTKIPFSIHAGEIQSMESLLEYLEEIPYSQRQKDMMKLGIIARNQSDGQILQALCKMALADDPYLRFTCIAGFQTYINHFKPEQLSSDVLNAVQHLLYDSSRHIYCGASSIAASAFGSFDALRLTAELPLPVVKVFCRALSRKGKESVLDACFKQESIMNNVKRRDAVAPYISEGFLLLLSNEVFLSFSRRTFQKLAVRLPLTMLQKIDNLIPSDVKSLDSSCPLPVEMLPLIYEVSKALASSKPHARRGLDLFFLTFHRLPIMSEKERNACLFSYMALYPKEVSCYVMQHPTVWQNVFSIPTRVRRRLYKLPSDLFTQLVLDHRIVSLTCFPEFPARHREMLYNAAPNRVRDEVPLYFLYLPDTITRQTEGSKLVNDATSTETDQARGMSVFSFSHLDGSWIERYLENVDVEVRTAGITAVIHSAYYYPDTLRDILSFCLRHRNERDPFQMAMCEALKSLKVSIWDEVHLPSLGTLIRSLCSAKDLSLTTAHHAMGLVLKVGWKFPDFTAAQIPIILERYSNAIPRKIWIPIKSAKIVWKALSSIAEDRLKKNQSCNMNSLFFHFFDETIMRNILDMIESFLLECMKRKNVRLDVREKGLPIKWTSPHILSMIPSLLKTRAQLASYTAVKHVVACRIGGESLLELLRPLAPSSEEGAGWEKNSSPKENGGLKYIHFSLGTRFYCWTSQQQKIYAGTLLHRLQNDTHLREKRELFTILSQLPSLTLEDHGIKAMVAPGFDCAYSHSLAMDLLGHMADVSSLNELCVAIKEEGNDSRAKDAIFPLSRRLKKLPFETAFPYLSPVLQCNAISIQREALRLMGSFGCDAAFRRLQVYEKEKGSSLHRDVKIALLESYYNFLPKPEVWEIYAEIVARTTSSTTVDSGAALLPPIIGIPDELLTMKWQREHFNDFILTLLSHSNRPVLLPVLERLKNPQKHEDPRWYPVITRLIESSYKDSTLCNTASEAILALRVDANQLAESVSVFSFDEALFSFVNSVSDPYVWKNNAKHERYVQVAYLLAKKLIDADRRPTLAAKCIMMCCPRVWIELLQEMSHAGQLHSGVQFLVLNIVKDEMDGNTKQFIDEVLEVEENVLRNHKEEFFRRLGLACIKLTDVQRLYESKLNQLLKIYRSDSSKWVSEEALSTAFLNE